MLFPSVTQTARTLKCIQLVAPNKKTGLQRLAAVSHAFMRGSDRLATVSSSYAQGEKRAELWPFQVIYRFHDHFRSHLWSCMAFSEFGCRRPLATIS